jgi:hypothetical protein
VVVISVAAYYSAYLLKGDDLRLNRIEIVDIDAESGTLRGTGFLGVFSPQIAKYDVAYTPGLGAAGKWGELPISPGGAPLGDDQVTGVSSWLGIDDDSLRGMGNEGSASLLGRRSYDYRAADRGTNLMVAGAPIQVWSVKAFMGQWLGKAGPTFDANLKFSVGGNLSGSIVNRMNVTLENVWVVVDSESVLGRAYEIPRIAPGQTIEINAIQARTLSDLLTQGEQVLGQGIAGSINPETLVRLLSFSERRGERSRSAVGNYQLRGLDLAHQLDVGRAILIGRVAGEPPADGATLWLNDPPQADGKPKDLVAKYSRNTFVRVVMQPVKGKE